MINPTASSVTYRILPSAQGKAWIDSDADNQVNSEQDSYITTVESFEKLDYNSLKAALKNNNGSMTGAGVGQIFNGSSTDIVNGSSSFGQLSGYRQDQSFKLENDEILYTLTPDESAPQKSFEDIPLVQSPDHQVMTTLEVDGALRLVFPGDVPDPKAKVHSIVRSDSMW